MAQNQGLVVSLPSNLLAFFDPGQFQSTGHTLIEILAEYLDKNLQGNGKVLNWEPPESALQHWQEPLPLHGRLSPEALLLKLREDILSANLHIHHPRNMGHQVAPPLPIAALCDLVAALSNQAMAVYETGPSATMLERQVLQWLGTLIGWDECEGVLTSGGAQANLTALLAARQKMATGNIWKFGVAQESSPLKILASEHAHYSVSRAAGIMGLGLDAVIKIPADKHGRMDTGALKIIHQHIESSKSKVMAVVATAGCTPTGSVDPLPEIATYCHEHDLWLHVDGAHGASALLSSRYRSILHGIELADSIVWDGHKLLYTPAAVSAVLFKHPGNSYLAFSQDASYLFQGKSQEEEIFNTSYRTLECTKRMMGLKLWFGFSLYGVNGLGELINQVFATAKLLAEKIRALEGFELLMPPQTNIVCFRYGSGDQSTLRKKLVETGSFYITQVTLDETTWLRTTIMNPLTTADDLDALLEEIRKLS